MSRLGKKPVSVPKGVKVSVSGRAVTVEGSKGSLTFEHRPEVSVELDEGGANIVIGAPEAKHGERETKAYWGTTRALLANMVRGVTEGFQKQLEVVGVGWTASVSGPKLMLKVGYANVIEVPIPTGLTVGVEKQLITISGADKQQVGMFASSVRAKRKPEPYNGKGIKYVDEVIQRKQGKAFGK